MDSPLPPSADSRLPIGSGPTLAAVTALDGAIAQAMVNFGPLVKDAQNSYLNTSYLPLDTLLAAVRPALVGQSVLISSSLAVVGGGFVVVTSLTHAGGGWRSSMFPVGEPMNPQKVAAAATYGLRVNLCQLLAVVGSDDDGQSAQPMPNGYVQTAPPTPQRAAAAPAAAGVVLPGEPTAWAPSPQNLASAAIPPGWAPPAAPQPAPSPFV